MTDDELLALVQSKSPEELTPQEVAQLRNRLAESEELRTALFETLQMESYLATVLGPVQLKPEQIVARAQQYRDDRIKTWTWVVAGLGCAAFIVLSIGALRSALNLGNSSVATLPQKEAEESVQPKSDEANKEAAGDDASSGATKSQGPMAEKSAESADATKPPGDQPRPAQPPPSDPWHAVLAMPAEQLPAFAEVCFDDFPYRSVLPRREVISQWFEAVPGRRYNVVDADTKKGKCGKIEGFARLRAPLPADGGVRFALEDYNRLSIHAWHGSQGVQLVYFEDQRQKWAAYATTRHSGAAKVDSLVLTATDDERARRAELRYGGPLELRYRDGELLLLRGDIVLVSAPLSGPPDDIYFDGKATFEGIALVRTKDFPLARSVDPPAKKLRGEDLAWSEKISQGAKFERPGDGSIRLASQEPKEQSYVFAPIPGLGFREVILEISDASPGFGVYLGHDDQSVRHLLRVVRNTKNKQLNIVLRGPDDFSEGELHPLPERFECVVGSKLWIKLLHGNGCLKWWLSADGVHWGIGDAILEDTPGRIAFVGITTCRTKQEAAGTLKSVTVRELPAINSLAPRELIERAPSLFKHTALESWSAAVVEACPQGVELSAWRRACAIRTLGDGLPRVLAEQLMEALLDDPATQQLPPEKQIEVLRDVMLVDTDPRDAAVWKKSYLTRLHDVGRRIAADGLPFSSVRRALMEAPVWSQHPLPVAASGQGEEELIRLLQEGRTEEALALCRVLRLYHFHENRPLFAWAEAAARRDTGRVTGEASRIKESWRHPLIEELNKEVYNFAADLHSIVESGAIDDASRMIASLEADRGGGLTPSGSDRDLFVSLSVAVKLAIAREPALRAELNKRLGPLSQLRVRQAIAGGDEAAIALAATQFEGTEAAAEAYRWLGDRALQNGWFARALAEYRRAETSAPASLIRELAPRARLAAAMMGTDHGSVITEPVSFGELNMAPGQFEALVAEMRARGTGTVQGAVASSAGNLPGPSQLTANNRARFDGPVGQNPHEDGAPRVSQWQIDYAGRQLATVVDGDVMYVSNRFQVAAYNTTNGQRLWQSQTPQGDMRRGQDWPLIPMRPLVTAGAIYARQLYGKSPSIVCFEKAGGKNLWQREGTDNEWWVSDPIFVQGQLLALNLLRDGNREMQLRLVSLDPLTGDVLVQRRLLGLRESWLHRKACEIAALDDGLIATLGGITLCCDAAGSVRWVRKQLALPFEERPEWVWQHFAPPLVIDSRVMAIQPGVETLECLDVATGSELWTFAEDRPRRIIGHSGGRIIVETDREIIALDLADGAVAWREGMGEEASPDAPARARGARKGSRRQRVAGLAADSLGPSTRLTAALVSEKFVVYMVKRGPVDKPKVPALVWLDAADGDILGVMEFPPWQDNDPRVGPLVVAKDRLWTFFSKEKDPNKDLVELSPGAPLAEVDAPAIGPWQRTLSAPLVQTLGEVAPGWQLVSGYPRKDVEKKAEWQGEKDAAVILSRPGIPAMLATEIDLPEGKKPKLNLRVGHEGKEPGQFTVRVDGETIFTQERKPDSANRWDSLSFDLAKFAGRQVVISLAYHTAGNDHAWWVKTLQVGE